MQGVNRSICKGDRQRLAKEFHIVERCLVKNWGCIDFVFRIETQGVEQNVSFGGAVLEGLGGRRNKIYIK